MMETMILGSPCTYSDNLCFNCSTNSSLVSPSTFISPTRGTTIIPPCLRVAFVLNSLYPHTVTSSESPCLIVYTSEDCASARCKEPVLDLANGWASRVCVPLPAHPARATPNARNITVHTFCISVALYVITFCTHLDSIGYQN